MRREAGDELGIEHLDNAIAPGVDAMAAHTKRHDTLVRRCMLNAIGNLDLRCVGRRERDERRDVESVAITEEVIRRHRIDADQSEDGAGDARGCAHRIGRVRISQGQSKRRTPGRLRTAKKMPQNEAIFDPFSTIFDQVSTVLHEGVTEKGGIHLLPFLLRHAASCRCGFLMATWTKPLLTPVRCHATPRPSLLHHATSPKRPLMTPLASWPFL